MSVNDRSCGDCVYFSVIGPEPPCNECDKPGLPKWQCSLCPPGNHAVIEAAKKLRRAAAEAEACCLVPLCEASDELYAAVDALEAKR